MKEFQFNCISYVYCEAGLLRKERMLNNVPKDKVMRRFEKVEKIEEADALAVFGDSEVGVIAIHMAIINEDLITVTHRKGIDAPVKVEKIDSALSDYINEPGAELVYLKFKPKSKLIFW